VAIIYIASHFGDNYLGSYVAYRPIAVFR